MTLEVAEISRPAREGCHLTFGEARSAVHVERRMHELRFCFEAKANAWWFPRARRPFNARMEQVFLSHLIPFLCECRKSNKTPWTVALSWSWNPVRPFWDTSTRWRHSGSRRPSWFWLPPIALTCENLRLSIYPCWPRRKSIIILATTPLWVMRAGSSSTARSCASLTLETQTSSLPETRRNIAIWGSRNTLGCSTCRGLNWLIACIFCLDRSQFHLERFDPNLPTTGFLIIMLFIQEHKMLEQMRVLTMFH